MSRRKQSRGNQDRQQSPRGGVVFKDRSGKIHGIRSRERDEEPRKHAPEPKPAHKPTQRKENAGFKKPIASPHRDRDFDSERGHGGFGHSGHEKKNRHEKKKRFDHQQSRDEKSGRKKKGKRDWREERDSSRSHERSRERPHDRGRAAGHGFGRGQQTRHFDGQATKRRANVDKNRKGFAFLVFDDKHSEDAFVPPRQADSLFHGDRVEVTLSRTGEVQHIKVLEHRFRELVGRYSPHYSKKSKGGFVIYERKRAREEVYVPEGANADAGDWVRAKLNFNEEGPFAVTAEVVEVYGPELPASADIGMIAAEYNLVEEHPEAAEKEAKAHTLDLSDKHRVDLRNVPFITIDGETARDFDDAIFVERDKSGFILWVAIADVSHYVKLGSALDKDARSRGTSVYFAERAFHMLPRALSENLCSLRPNEPRLTLVSKMWFDRNGERQKTEVMEAVIESQRRATYNQIQEEWEKNQKNKDWEYAPHFNLYQQIRKVRSDRGSLDFDLPEAEVRVEPNGVPISITQRGRLDAHRLIEEFMIAANEAVTEWIMERGWPFIYRIHDEPAEQSLAKFQKLAATVGVNASFSGENLHQSLSELVRRFEGNPAAPLLNMALLRSMKQAIYSSTHGIHFGLASKAYTHFTSPIRRYPDLVVHRILRQVLRIESKRDPHLNKHQRDELEAQLEEIAEHCSYRERLASDAERESIKLKQVRIMVPKLGEEYDGKVIGMTENGLFVQIPDPYVEGMIPQDSMMDDYYEFNEERMIFYGRRKKRTFKVGDLVKVRAVRADIDRRQIDFQLIDAKSEARSDSKPHPKSDGKKGKHAR